MACLDCCWNWVCLLRCCCVGLVGDPPAGLREAGVEDIEEFARDVGE